MDKRAYDAALVCTNGHQINSSYHNCSHDNLKFCGKCGAKTIHECPSCSSEIRGDLYEVEYDEWTPVGIGLSFDVPVFCGDCGEPYPWTKAKLEVAKVLTSELDGLTADDKNILSTSLTEIMTPSPRTELAAMRIKKMVGKVGKESAGVLKQFIAEIACEMAKKSLGM